MLGEKVREARLRAGLSQQALCKKIEIQQRRLSKIETNNVDWIRTDTLRKLCDVLHVTPNELLDYENQYNEYHRVP